MFKNIISLGYFCSVARELEKCGLRSTSSPFDWLISSWSGVESAIRNHFEGFLDYENLSQVRDFPNRYKNDRYNLFFFHDFNQYDSLSMQLPAVKEKYDRRIERFYTQIQSHTLFIRYVQTAEEFDYLSKNIDSVNALFKSFNPQNELLIIANDGLYSEHLHMFNVTPDDGRRNAEFFASKNPEIGKYFQSGLIDEKLQSDNLKVYQQKVHKKNSIASRAAEKIKSIAAKGKKPYEHSKYVYWN